MQLQSLLEQLIQMNRTKDVKFDLYDRKGTEIGSTNITHIEETDDGIHLRSGSFVLNAPVWNRFEAILKDFAYKEWGIDKECPDTLSDICADEGDDEPCLYNLIEYVGKYFYGIGQMHALEERGQ